MERLKFVTKDGVCGHTVEWSAKEATYDAMGWLDDYGHKIGSGPVVLPNGDWIDLSQFAVILNESF